MRIPFSKKISIVIILVLVLAVMIFLLFPNVLLEISGFYKRLINIYSSTDSFKEYTLSFGIWAPLAFFLAHILQIIIAPIPGNIVAMVGGALFGVLKGLILSGSGQVIGSIIAFYLARIFGKPLVIKLVGRRTYEKYNKVFSGRFVFGLFLIFLFPFFPDDALCFLAGLSILPFFIFIILVVLGRLPGIFVATLAGAGVINLSVIQWGIMAAVSFILVLLFTRYKAVIEEWLYARAIKLKVNKNIKSQEEVD